MKNEFKIREMLDIKKYHLCTSNTGDWWLYRKYDDMEKYFSPDNKPIMTSKTHTEKDLLKFAKEHRIIDLMSINITIRLLLVCINMIICMASIILNNNFLRGTNWTLNIFIIIWALIDFFISEHNFKVEIKEYEDRIKIIKQKLEKKLNKKEEEL